MSQNMGEECAAWDRPSGARRQRREADIDRVGVYLDFSGPSTAWSRTPSLPRYGNLFEMYQRIT